MVGNVGYENCNFSRKKVSISSPSSEGGGNFSTDSFGDLSVSISSPSSEGGGNYEVIRSDDFDKFPLVLLQAKVVGLSVLN